MSTSTAAALNERVQLEAQMRFLEEKLRGLTRPQTETEANELASARARADAVELLYGRKALPPLPGERPLRYRQRLAGSFQKHSPNFRKADLNRLDADVFGPIEDVIYNDAAAAARDPASHAPGTLTPLREVDASGRTITRWTGDSMVWRQHFMTGAQVGRIRTPKEISDLKSRR